MDVEDIVAHFDASYPHSITQRGRVLQEGRVAEIWIDIVDLSEEASHRLATIDPSIAIDRVDGGIVLRSETSTRQRIEDAWLCVMTNERLLHANAEARHLVLAELLA